MAKEEAWLVRWAARRLTTALADVAGAEAVVMVRVEGRAGVLPAMQTTDLDPNGYLVLRARAAIQVAERLG